MVGMPVFIDQKDVLKRMEEKGVGLGVPKGAPADEIHAAIVKVSGRETRTKPVNKSQHTYVCSLNLKIQPFLLTRTGPYLPKLPLLLIRFWLSNSKGCLYDMYLFRNNA